MFQIYCFPFRRAQSVGVSDPDAEVRGRGLHHGVPLHVPAARRPHAPPRDDPRTVLRAHPHQALQEPLPGESGIEEDVMMFPPYQITLGAILN